MFTRPVINSFRLSRIMSGNALERIIVNNKLAEQTLEALKREVSAEIRRQSSNQIYATFFVVFVGER